MYSYPSFTSDNKTLNEAFRIAVGDIVGNILHYGGGLLSEEKPCLMAGLDYEQPWTRDTAINIWYALAMLDGEICKNTLLSVLETKDGKPVVAGSYGQTWDNVIWGIGAAEYLAFHDDPEFFSLAQSVLENTLQLYEATHFSKQLNLFSGEAVYADGIASYPDNIAEKIKNHEAIYALSTNCVYYQIYRICAEMAKKSKKPFRAYEEKAENMKAAILRHFPNPKTGLFDYFYRDSDAQEGLGLSYAILFDIADRDQAKSFFKNAHITPNGISCEWPPFSRYTDLGKGEYGRHCGTVWPMINGAWALAARKAEENEVFERELFLLAEKAVRDLNFYEIYHPDTGIAYGGLQEWEGKIVLWQSCRKQTWSATAYLAMLLRGIAGIAVSDDRLTLRPYLPSEVNEITIKGLKIRNRSLNLRITREEGHPSAVQCKLCDLPEKIILTCKKS